MTDHHPYDTCTVAGKRLQAIENIAEEAFPTQNKVCDWDYPFRLLDEIEAYVKSTGFATPPPGDVDERIHWLETLYSLPPVTCSRETLVQPKPAARAISASPQPYAFSDEAFVRDFGHALKDIAAVIVEAFKPVTIPAPVVRHKSIAKKKHSRR